MQDRAAKLLGNAGVVQERAEKAQDAAYAKHLAGIAARRAAFVSQSPEDKAVAKAAWVQEEAAYADAAEAWKSAADSFGEALGLLTGADAPNVGTVRWARDRALIRSGQIAAGINDLEDLLESLPVGEQGMGGGTADKSVSGLETRTREELATGYYYGARLMRLGGHPAAEWREVSGKARQNFRYLAESGKNKGEDATRVRNLQNNLELVLNLEQSSSEELVAKPQPKNSPRADRDGFCDSKGKKKGKKPNGKKRDDSRDGGGQDQIGGGW